jgi:glycerol kinase
MDVLKAMEADSGIPIEELRVDGGASENNVLMQFQADVLSTVTVRPKIIETTAMGAAFLAGLAIGFWESLDEIQKMWEVDQFFQPTNNINKINNHVKEWHKALDALDHWTNDKS